MASGLVFVVDGDPAVRDSLRTLLDLNGFAVETFATGHGLQTHGDFSSCVCIVCEAELPDTSGVSIHEWLRSREIATPFALMLSRRDGGVLEAASRAGIEPVFMKPLVHRRLLEFIVASSDGPRWRPPADESFSAGACAG